MYVDRMDLIAGLGAAPALQEAMVKIGEVRKGEPGYLGQTLLRSYAHPNKFTVVGRWESIEAAWAFSSSDALATFLKSMPAESAGAFTRTRFDGYDSVLEVDADKLPPMEEARCEVLADWELSSIGKAAEYVESRRELFALQKENVEGFVSARLRRSSGIPTKYLMIGIYTSREAAQSGQGSAKLREFVGSHPAASYANTPPGIEAYAVIHRM
jgi:quinol monooxygenase YgiN